MNSNQWEMLPWLVLYVSFFGTLAIGGLYMGITSLRPWHNRFHVNRGINRAFSCNHCAELWIKGQSR